MPRTVHRFRAFQTAADKLRVDLIPMAEFRFADDGAQLKRLLQRRLGASMHIEIRLVDDIPFEGSSKLRYFVPLDDSAGDMTNVTKRQPDGSGAAGPPAGS
jgi:hypothetical protein